MNRSAGADHGADLNLHKKFDGNDLKGARLGSPLTKFEDLSKE